MQNVILKKLCLFLYIFFALHQEVISQNQNYLKQINQADSLFTTGNFEVALKKYEQVLAQSGKASPGILLKTAYIYEGLQDYTKALYYLSLYYSYKPNQLVVDKMKELATKHNLKGYEFKDVDFFMVLYERYYFYIAAGMLFVCALSLSSIVIRKLRRHYLPARHIVGFLLFLVVVFLFLNIKKNVPRAIIARDNVYLMEAPSAGARLIDIMPKGHRLDVKASKDIWLQVVWDNQTAFVRQQNVLLIR
jgi:tetratricopeptide (TPR) repeat protein